LAKVLEKTYDKRIKTFLFSHKDRDRDVHVNKPSKKQLLIFKPKKLRNHAMKEA